MVQVTEAFRADISLTKDDELPDFERSFVDENDKPVDLTGATIEFKFKKRNATGAQTSITCTIVGNPKLGRVRVPMTGAGIAVAGDYLAEFKITAVDTRVFHVPSEDVLLLRVRDRA